MRQGFAASGSWDPVPFAVLWAGQFVSVLGTLMTNFSIVLWAWQRTGQTTPVAMVEFCSFGAVVVFGPLAGALCDRWGRLRTLAASNAAAALLLAVLASASAIGSLSTASVYTTLVALGIVLAFQYPALLASVTFLVPQRHYARASGLLSLALSVAGVAAPATAAVVLSHGGLSTVFAIDLATYAFCALALTAVARHVREPEPVRAAPRRRLRLDLAHGFRYIVGRPGLRALQTLFFLAYFATMFGVLISPMVLARSGADGSAALAAVLGAAGAGGVAGGAVAALWGRHRSQVKVILAGFVLIGLLGQAPLGVSGSPAIWTAASFASAFLYPLVESANQSLWQSSTPMAEQGRIFAARRVLTESAGVTVLLVAGPLADGVFEPGMRESGWLRSAFGWLTGVGPGSGMAVLLLASGVLTAASGVWGCTVRALWDLDRPALAAGDEHPPPEDSATIKDR